MRTIEAFNKVLVGILLVLVCLQASLLFVMKNMQDQAKVRLIENETPVDMKCGEAPFANENYWNPLEREISALQFCKNWDCEKSSIVWREPSAATRLHVVAVKSAPPMRWQEQDPGGIVRVRVPASETPQILALSSETMHEWRLVIDPKANLQKVIIATPTVVWIDGVPENTPIEYLSKEKMCSYPYAWEEVHNPDNQFRLFVGALKKITGVLPSSFQGAVVGRDFVVPRNESQKREAIELPVVRGLASVHPQEVSLQDSFSVVWARQAERVVAQKVLLMGDEAVLPEHTQGVSGEFILRKSQLHVWNSNEKKYEHVNVPLSLPPLENITAIAIDDSQPQRVFVFNEDLGGEIYSYDHKEKSWALIKSGVPSAIRALLYNSQEKVLYGLASRGRTFTDIVVLSPGEKADLQRKPLMVGIPFDPVRWKWEMVHKDHQLHLVLHTPLDPKGESHKILYQ